MRADEIAISTYSLCKTYTLDGHRIEALKDLNLNVEVGELVAINGHSGSGKTTLLNLISGIDRPTDGEMTVFGENLTVKDENLLADFRCNKVGFVFQSYNLVSTLTVAENIAFPMEWIRKPAKELERRVSELLIMLGLEHRADHFPAQLSGGEQQRVAFARALANDPPLLLADEPTGNLDTENGQRIADLLQRLKTDGRTVVAATHDTRIMRMASQKLRLEHGRLVTRDE